MTALDIFQFRDYRGYVTAALGGEARRTGQRANAAKAMGCQQAYLSQILRGQANLSLEQAYSLASFLSLGPDEREMLLLLVQKERAGNVELREHFERQISELIARRQLIKNRLNVSEVLTADDAATFYGSWLYACVHLLVMIPGLDTRDAIAQKLGVDTDEVARALDFLESRGLSARGEDGRYRIGPQHVHLPEDSPNIRKHHANWRLKALQSLDRRARPAETHYAAIVTLSKADAMAIKERTLRYIQENMTTVKASPEETLYCSVIDWFEVPLP